MKSFTWIKSTFTIVPGIFYILLVTGTAHAETLSGEVLVKALRQGGYAIVMRHANSPTAVPNKQTANADNTNLERQLSEAGRTGATAMGKALRELKIPIGEVFTSPAYRALETAQLAQFTAPIKCEELGDRGHSMQDVSVAQSEWLQKKMAQVPTGSNRIIVTHMPNITQAIPQVASGVSDGEALVFGSDGKGGTELVARIKIEEWQELAL